MKDAWYTGAAPSLDTPLAFNPHYSVLSARTRNRLNGARIFSLADLVEWDGPSLLRLDGFGLLCLGEVNVFLEANHLLPLLAAADEKPSEARHARNYEAISAETRTSLSRAGIHSGRDLEGAGVGELLAIPGMDTGAFDEFVAAGVLPRVRNGQDLLLVLCGSERVRRAVEDHARWWGFTDAVLDALERCQTKFDEQVDLGTLHEKTAMDFGPVQAFNSELLPPARTMPDLLRRMQYFPGQEAASVADRLDGALEVSTIDEELAWLFGRLDERSAEVLRARFAFGKRPTLDELGARYGVSRERIRQLERTISGQLREAYHWEAPLLRTRTAMLLVREQRLVSPADIYERLSRVGLIASEASITDFLLMWRAMDPDEGLLRDHLTLWKAISPSSYAFPEGIASFVATGLDERQTAAAPAILKAALTLVRQVGAVTPAQIVAGGEELGVGEEGIGVVLSARGMREILPGYWTRLVGKPVPYTVTRKMLAVCGPLTLRHIRRGLLRHQRRQGYPVAPVGVLRAVLEQHDELLLEEDGTVHLEGDDAEVTLGAWEQVWLRTVREEGPVVHTDTIHRAFARNGLQPVTAYALTRRSSLIEPVGRQLFCLPGARVTDADIDRGRNQALKIDSDSTLAYEETGDVVFETTAQQYMDRNGVLGAGPALVMSGRWKMVVNDDEIGEFTVGQPWIYGLAKARDALGLRAGLRIGIRFDTWTRRGHVYLARRDDG